MDLNLYILVELFYTCKALFKIATEGNFINVVRKQAALVYQKAHLGHMGHKMSSTQIASERHFL